MAGIKPRLADRDAKNPAKEPMSGRRRVSSNRNEGKRSQMSNVKLQFPVERKVYTVAETEQVLRMGHSKVCGLIREGRLQSVKIDGRRLVWAESVHAILGM
jgi:hypothetical protein